MRGKMSRRRQSRRNPGSSRLSRVVHSINKEIPFLVRRNRELLSTPAHRENGLNIERFFRIEIFNENPPTPTVITTDTISKAIFNELGIAEQASVDFILKEVRLYSKSDMRCFFHYDIAAAAGASLQSYIQCSDYVNSQSGLSHLDVVYPNATKQRWSNGSTARPIVDIITGGYSPVTDRAVICDFCVYVSSRAQQANLSRFNTQTKEDNTSSEPVISELPVVMT